MSKGVNMKKLSILSAIFGFAFIGAASAADVTLYYSPTCPHCHHAREFIEGTLVYEYPTISVTQVNVMDQANLPAFQEVLKKCEYESGGVPVMVIGEKCFQGYADFMQQELRDAVEADMKDSEKAQAAENKQAIAENAEEFKAQHTERANVIVEHDAAAAAEQQAQAGAKSSSLWFYGLLIVLVAALGFVLIRKKK